MEIVLNGKRHQIDPPCSLADLVGSMDRPTGGMVVVYNDEVVVPSQWEQIVLKHDDVVELVEFVSGG